LIITGGSWLPASARNAKAEYGAALAADYARLIADAIAKVFPG
jgi:hypothetical protein